MRLTSICGLLVCILALVAPAEVSGEDRDFERWRADVEALGLDPGEVIYPFSATPEMQSWAEQQMM